MLEVDMPTFHAAHVRHLDTLIQDGHHASLVINNESSSLFSNLSQKACRAILTRGAIAITKDIDCSSTIAGSFYVPDL